MSEISGNVSSNISSNINYRIKGLETVKITGFIRFAMPKLSLPFPSAAILYTGIYLLHFG